MPIEVFDFVKIDKKINARGNWKPVYYKNEMFLSVDIKFEKKDSIGNKGTSWSIYLKNNKPVILIEIGDPDACRVIRFIKN